ncbi:MAG: hypothetical protein R3B47_14205 [Bacteroidia bacterium]
MAERKIIQLLRSFSRSELIEFQKFIASEYINPRPELVRLMEGLAEYAPEFASEAVDYEQLYAGAFPDESYNENRLTKKLFYLNKLAEQFVLFESAKNQPMENSFVLLHYYNSRKLPSLFLHQLKECYKLWEKIAHPSSRDYNWYYMIEMEYSNFLLRNNHLKGSANLEVATKALDAYFLQEKLKLGTAMVSRQNIVNTTYKLPLLESLEEFLADKIDAYIPEIRVWFSALQLTRMPQSEEHFSRLKTMVLSNIDKLGAGDSSALLILLQNTARYIYPEDEQYYSVMYSLYHTQIEHGLLFQNGALLPGLVNNIVTTGLKLGKLAWAEDFLEKYKDYIPEEYRQNTYWYNLANINFAQKAYPQTLAFLNRLEYQDPFFTLRIKRLQLKTYYELQEWELLDTTINSSRVYLHRLEKISERYKALNLLFVNSLSSLFKLRTCLEPSGGSDQTLDDLRSSIMEIPVLPERDWLMLKTGSFAVQHQERLR